VPTLFSTATLTRFASEAENIFQKNFPCIIDRTSIAIVSGTAIYTLADYVIDIRRITWKGTKVYPMTHRRYREAQVGVTATGTPYEYIFDNIGASQIRFFPIPNIAISQLALDIGLWGSNIANGIVIEYYRTPDYVTYTIPAFFRKRLIKSYVMKMCFSIEGRGQNLKAVKYWDAKWKYYTEIYGALLNELINAPRHIIAGPDSVTKEFSPRRPMLPYNKIGIGVDKGE